MSNVPSGSILHNLKAAQGLQLQIWTKLTSLDHPPCDSHQVCFNSTPCVNFVPRLTLRERQIFC